MKYRRFHQSEKINLDLIGPNMSLRPKIKVALLMALFKLYNFYLKHFFALFLKYFDV